MSERAQELNRRRMDRKLDWSSLADRGSWRMIHCTDYLCSNRVYGLVKW